MLRNFLLSLMLLAAPALAFSQENQEEVEVIEEEEAIFAEEEDESVDTNALEATEYQ